MGKYGQPSQTEGRRRRRVADIEAGEADRRQVLIEVTAKGDKLLKRDPLEAMAALLADRRRVGARR